MDDRVSRRTYEALLRSALWDKAAVQVLISRELTEEEREAIDQRYRELCETVGANPGRPRGEW